MKKVILSTLMLLVAVMMSAATYTWEKVVDVKLTDGNNDTYTSTFGAATELTGAASWGAVPANLEGATVRAYTTLAGVDYEQLFLNSIENLPLTIKTYNSTSLTFTLTALYGEIKLYDNGVLVLTVKKGSATETGNYECTVGIEETITGRFVINYDAYPVTLNGQYLATFSAPENVIIPDGLNAYTAEFQGEQDYLLVHKITTGYIPANTGVILFNPLGGTTSTQYDFSLVKYAGDVDPIEGTNELKPSSAWVYPFEGTVYVLHDSEMWLYNGANMKPNKAFLHVQSSNAPQRIRMVFSEEQGIESIAAEGKAVKFVENGRVFIKRGEKIYNLQGQLVK